MCEERLHQPVEAGAGQVCEDKNDSLGAVGRHFLCTAGIITVVEEVN